MIDQIRPYQNFPVYSSTLYIDGPLDKIKLTDFKKDNLTNAFIYSSPLQIIQY